MQGGKAWPAYCGLLFRKSIESDPIDHPIDPKRINTSTQTLTYATTSNRMTKNGSTTQTLDPVGNLITNGTKTYAYNNANRLLTYSVSGTVKAQMQYNALGQRTAKLQITQPMHFHYDGSNQLIDTTQYTSTGALAPWHVA